MTGNVSVDHRNGLGFLTRVAKESLGYQQTGLIGETCKRVLNTSRKANYGIGIAAFSVGNQAENPLRAEQTLIYGKLCSAPRIFFIAGVEPPERPPRQSILQ